MKEVYIMPKTRETLAEFIDRVDIQVKFESISVRKHDIGMPPGSRHYKARLTNKDNGRRMSTEFSIGPAINEPILHNLLSSLQCDCICVINNDFDSFIDELGMEDNRDSRLTYKACQIIERKLKQFMDNEFDNFLECQE